MLPTLIKFSALTLVSLSINNKYHVNFIMLSLGITEISIMASGSPIVGETFTLVCSAGGSEGTFQWLKGPPDHQLSAVSL